MSATRIGDTSFAGMIEEIAAATPDAPAVEGEGAVGYGELDELGRRAAAGLAGLGIGEGDRVGLWLPNVTAYLALLLGCARLGAVAVSINTRFRSTEVADIVRRSGAKALVLWPGFRQIDFARMLAEIPADALGGVEAAILYGGGEAAGTIAGKPAVAYEALLDASPMAEDAATPDAPFIMFTTSGTTKAPKFVLHTHASVVDHARIVAGACGFKDAGAKSLLSIPLCGIFGFGLATATLAAGKPMVLMPAFDAGEAARLVDAHAITHIYGSDDLFRAMLDAAPEPKPFPSLRLCGFAAFNAALADLVDAGDARGVAFVGVYGSSEVQPLVTCQDPNAPPDDRRPGGGVITTELADVRIRDPESGQLLPAGAQGEIEYRGPSLFREYSGNPEATATAFTEDGYFRTGDLGYLAEDGRMIFLARMGDALRLGGFLVNPAEIEAHVETHASVGECKVVGVETGGGTRPVAFCIPAEGTAIDEKALGAHCAAGIAKYKVPVRFFEIDAFPMAESPNGLKVQRPKLQALAAERIAQPAD